MNLTPEEPDNVIAINPDVAADLEITLKAKESFRKCFGLHKKVTVDQQARTLTCRHCGFVVDPFEYIERWALDGDRRMTALKNIDHEIRIRSAENQDLQRQINNHRSTLKRLGAPQCQKERQRYSTARLNPEKAFPEDRPMKIIHMSFGGPMRKISVNGEIIEFEMHPYCGPTILDKHGSPAKNQPDEFLNAASLWAQQGQRIEGGLCRWDYEPEPIIVKWYIKPDKSTRAGMHNVIVGHKPARRGE